MKRTISLLTVFAFVLAFSGSVFAQSYVTASTQIVTSIAVKDSTSLQFGQLQNNFSSNPSIAPDGTSSNTGTGTVQVGKATITGDPGVDFNVTVTAPSNLSNGTDNIPFTADFLGSQDNDATTTGDNTALTSGTQKKVTTNSSSNYYLFLGGSLTAPGSTISSGKYTGTIIINVSYL